ncbi:MAG: hypothetical protein E7373_06575 [Clostridiales bacterium]|nr:hypothetical protein [Clostridiales bacterium]
MILDDFIDKIFRRYVCNTDIDEKREEYASGLFHLSGKVDFDLLLDYVSKSNKKDFVPQVSELLEWSKSCYKQEYKKGPSGWVHVRVYDPRYKTVRSTDCFPATDTEEQILAWYKKRFKCDGWRIEEIYA